MIPHRYKLAPEEDAARAEELGKLVARRPEWRLELCGNQIFTARSC